MTRPDPLDGETDILQDVIRYTPGLLLIGLTVGVSLVDHFPVNRPSQTMTIGILAVPAVALALGITRSSRDPSGARIAALAVLSWLVFSLARVPLLDPSSTRIAGSIPVLLDLCLVWAGSYAIAAAVVYRIDWPAVGAPAETTVGRDRTDPVADD